MGNSVWKYVVLGGKSLKNKAWVDQVVKSISQELHSFVEGWDYRYWIEDADFDFIAERSFLKEELNSINGSYIVICKSVGAVLVISLLEELDNLPVALHIFGLPKDELPKCMSQLKNIDMIYDGQLHIYQNTRDPAWNLSDIQWMIPDLTIKELNWDTHSYRIEDVIDALKKTRQ